MVGLICLSHLRADKLTSAVDKPFEEISTAVCERISHKQPDNVNSYQTDKEFLWMDGSAVQMVDNFLWTDSSAVQMAEDVGMY